MFVNNPGYAQIPLEVATWEGFSSPDLPTQAYELLRENKFDINPRKLLLCGVASRILTRQTHGTRYHTYGTTLHDLMSDINEVNEELRNPFWWADEADFDHPTVMVYDLDKLQPAYSEDGGLTGYGHRFASKYGAEKLDIVTFGTEKGNLDPATLCVIELQPN